MTRATRTDHYVTLGIGRAATQAEIKQAYRVHAKRYHPDRDPSPQATRAFLAAQTAYETLSDPLQRMAHDALLRPTHRDPAYRRAQPAEPVSSVVQEPNVDMRTRHWAFFGLHLTGLLFGLVLVMGICTGITYRNWPWPAIFFTIPGLVVIPDAWEGLRLWSRRKKDVPV